MKTILNQGIGIFENAVSDEWCDEGVKIFHDDSHEKFLRRDNTSALREDLSIDLFSPDVPYVSNFITHFFSNIYPIYIHKYFGLNNSGRHSFNSFKIQKTLPTEGYHVWHFEADTIETSKRLAAFIVYLNDVEEGGETEFLYQSLRVKPKKGTLCLFPAGYYHLHRGNPPLSGVKYIVTGWIDLIEEDNE